MKSDTALAFMAASTCIFLLVLKRRQAADFFAALTIFIGAISLVGYLLRWNFQQMAPNSAFNLVATGLSLLLIDSRSRRATNWSQSLSFVSGSVALVAFVGHAFQVKALYAISSYVGMAAPSALAFVMINAASLLIMGESGVLRPLLEGSAPARFGRRLLIAVAVGPISIGWLCSLGYQHGLFNAAFGFSLMAIACANVFAVLIWLDVRKLNRAEANERLAEDKLRTAYSSLEEQFKQKTQHLQLALEAGQLGAFDFDLKHGRLRWTKKVFEIFGVEFAEGPLPVDRFISLIHPEDRQSVARETQLNMNGAGKHDMEFRVVRPVDGNTIWVRGQGKTFFEEGKPDRMVGILQDITAQKKNEALMAERSASMMVSSKMVALAEMASGIAHEINNPLTVIHGNAFLLAEKLSRNDGKTAELSALAGKICATSLRIRKIIEGLQAFAHDDAEIGFSEVSLSSIVNETLNFCGERFRKHGIDLRVKVDDPDLIMSCRPVQVTQILLNLLNNAHDALENAPRKWVKLEVGMKGSRVFFAVTDSGPGITESLKQKIFHPFFTTKPVGKGTGLGLSISRGLAEANGGSVFLEQSSSNTRFVLDLPVRRETREHPEFGNA